VLIVAGPEDLDYDLDVIHMREPGQVIPDSHEEVTDEPSPTKKAKFGSRGEGGSQAKRT